MAHGGVDVQGASGMELEAARAAIDQLARDIITGEVSAPLTEQDGKPITDEDGNVLMATRRLVTQAMLDRLAAELLAETGQMFQSLPKTLTADKLLMPDKVTTIAQWMESRPRRNLLDNGYLADPINQRGQMEYIGRGYTVDRYTLLNSNGKVTVGDGEIIVSNESETNGLWFVQYGELNLMSQLSGQDVCLSALCKSTGNFKLLVYVDDSVVCEVSKGLTDNYGIVSCTGKMPNGETASKWQPMTLYLSPGTKVHLKAAMFELGLVQTLAHKNAAGEWVLNDQAPDKTLELLKCQRHFYRMKPEGGQLMIATGSKVSYELAGFSVVVPVAMRVKPTIKTNDASLLSVADYSSGAANVTALNVPSMAGNTLRVNAYGDFSDLAYGIMGLFITSSNAYIDFDANL